MSEDEWSLKKYYLNDQDSYHPDCDHQMWTKEQIDKHNAEAEDQVKCSHCNGTGFYSRFRYEKLPKYGKIWHHDESKKCMWCEGKKTENKHYSKRTWNEYCHGWYSEEDIETLREKLINDISKDIEDYVGTYGLIIMNGYTWYNYRDHLIEIINKRFGHD